MTFDRRDLEILDRAIASLDRGFGSLPEVAAQAGTRALEDVLAQVAVHMRDNFPYQHPLYAGQMLKPPHPIARLAYALAMYLNPNNHALDGGRASSAMEKEAVAEIAAMFGWGTHLGHLTSGGTMANLEALWVAGLLAPGKTVLASEQAHYTHARVSAVLALSFESVAVDERGRMDVEALEQRLTGGDVGTVVATLGTTGTGAVDPLSEILSLQQRYGFRLHVDAAYGGYYRLVEGLENDVAAAFRALDSVDSIVVDPHKHGLQPYGCGCILFRDPAVGRFYKHESPYTYFSSDELHLGEISLECSRPGAAAVALWATHRLLPLVPGGEFARDLGKCRQAAVELHQRLASDPRFLTPVEPDLDIFVWAPAGSSASEVSVRSRALFTAAARRNLHLATFDYPTRLFQSRYPQLEADRPAVTCLRSCLMKPEHLDWLDEIWRLLSEAMEDVGTG